MKLTLTIYSVCAILLATAAYGADTYRLDHERVLFVEPGDSYLALFGSDWMKVFQANNQITFYQKGGELTHSPDKLVVGTRLALPAGARLTKRAMERLGRYEKIRTAALAAIREAESFLTPQPGNGTEAYRQASQLLEKAREASNGLTFGFENYLEAEQLARESIRHFKIDKTLQETINDMKDLEKAMEQTPHWKRAAPLALLLVLFASVIWFMRRAKRKERFERVRQWLEKQPERFDGMEKMRI